MVIDRIIPKLGRNSTKSLRHIRRQGSCLDDVQAIGQLFKTRGSDDGSIAQAGLEDTVIHGPPERGSVATDAVLRGNGASMVGGSFDARLLVPLGVDLPQRKLAREVSLFSSAVTGKEGPQKCPSDYRPQQSWWCCP